MDSRYDHSQHEQQMYQLWLDAGAFSADKKPSAPQKKKTKTSTPTDVSHPPLSTESSKSFTIMMPPPNANDPLHIGHAMFITLEDILIRYHRMLGDQTLWLPGTDHAGIETQFVFERKLKKQGSSRFAYDRETLYSMIWDYVQENSDVAVNQMKKLGASADWDRFVFMLDDRNVEVALETFQKLYHDGLVYRDQQLVNYCTNCGTAFSNLEIEHEQRTSPFYTIKYGDFTIGTVRPETKFRDTALAVNPSDERYAKHIGKTFTIQGLLGPVEMKVIADEGVDPEFGTGIMKVTPAHDPHDFELGQRYDLPVTPIITPEGKMDMSWFLEDEDNQPDSKQNKGLSPEARALKIKYWNRASMYHGLKVAKMREVMKEHFEEDGLLVSYDPNYTHNLSVCYRCKRPIEPLPLPQFFIKVESLVKPILDDLKSGAFTVHGAGHDKILKHWLENLRDWNISRQIVWGIRMPIWYDITKNPDLMVSFIYDKKIEISGKISDLMDEKIDQSRHIKQTSIKKQGTHTVERLPKAFTLEEITAGLQELNAPVQAEYVLSTTPPGDTFIQETDTFDTWFSSSQWPFSTLKALDHRNDEELGTDNFERFYPTQVMETGYDILPFWVMRMLFMGRYATGKLPFTDVYMHGLARDQKGQKMSKSKGNVINPLDIVEQYGADALRMALVIRSSAGLDKSVGQADFKAMRNFTNKIWNAARFISISEFEIESDTNKADAAFEQKLTEVVSEITQQLNDFKIGLAAETVFNYFWHWYCDECIEATKEGKLSPAVLRDGLETFLKLLHPFMPFVTEAVWQELSTDVTKSKNNQLITQQWPNS